MFQPENCFRKGCVLSLRRVMRSGEENNDLEYDWRIDHQGKPSRFE